MTTIIERDGFYVKVQSIDPKNQQQKLERLINGVCETMNITIGDLKSKSRDRDIVIPRQFICFVAYERGYGSLKFIGRGLNRHYSTVIHARDTVRDLIESNNKEFMFIYNSCKHLIK